MDQGQASVDWYNDNGLPFGYRFHPSDFEILQYYLLPKLKGETLPSAFVKDLDVYKYDPQQLPLNESNCAREDEAYFFVPVTRDLLQGNDKVTRATPNGCWKVLKHSVTVYGPDGAIGYKNKLEYYHGNNKTDWKMIEYRTNFRVNGHLESCMVCRVNLKVNSDEIYVEEDEAQPVYEMGSYGEAENIE